MSPPNPSTITTSGDGLSASQPISVPDSQESVPGHRQLTAEDYGLMDYDENEELPGLHTTSASELPQSPVQTTRSDSPNSSSRLDPNDRGAVDMAEDDSFINEQDPAPSTHTNGPPATSQDPNTMATLSQEVGSLERFPTPKSPSRLEPGAYAERPSTGDNVVDDDGADGWVDQNEDQADAGGPPNLSPRVAESTQMETDETFADEDEVLAQFIEIDPTRCVAVSVYRAPGEGHPQADGLAIRDASRPYGNIPTGAVRYEMPPGFKGQQDAHRDWLEDAIEAAVPRVLKDCAQPWTWSTFVHTQGPEARHGVVDVFAGSTEIQLRLHASELPLPGRGTVKPFNIRATGIGLRAPPRYVAGRSRYTKPISEQDARKAFDAAVVAKNDWLVSQYGPREPRTDHTPGGGNNRSPSAQYFFVIEAWLLYKKTNRGHVFANEVLALFYIPPRQKVDPVTEEVLPPSMAHPLTEVELRYLPSFIGEADQLFFQDRPKYCWGCKGQTFYLHRTENCINTKVPCGSCGRRNHAGIECPRNAAKTPVAAGHSNTSSAATSAATAHVPPSHPTPTTTFSYKDLVAGQAQAPSSQTPKRPTTTRNGSSSVSPSSGPSTPSGPTAAGLFPVSPSRPSSPRRVPVKANGRG
ncbi:hypothetical protein V8E36_003425 [Tilletia maclaganii]